ISGVALTTISPSSTSSSRNTPCVDGCCGPIEIVICVSSGRSTISNCGGMLMVLISLFLLIGPIGLTGPIGRQTKNQPLFQAIRFIPPQRKVLAQGMALPIIRQKNSSQIGMFVENNTEEIEGFALVPVRGPPNAGDRRYMNIIFVKHNLQTKPVMPGCR